MSRSLRTFCPGQVFHVTARIQCRAPLLLGLETAVITMIRESSHRSDARLVAYVVMPNHLHVVLQQGARPLGHYMQPLLRRIALLVRRCHSWEGHVFERRYRDSACISSEYLRNAIAYVHLNGQRAGLAENADAHPWSSHQEYSGTGRPVAPDGGIIHNFLRVFAVRAGDPIEECRANYLEFISWRMLQDAHRATDGLLVPAPVRPVTTGGDDHWATVLAPTAGAESRNPRVRLVDLRDLALIAIREVEEGMDLDTLRAGGRAYRVVRARRHVIARARAAGHSVVAIARFLSVSPTTVSLNWKA